METESLLYFDLGLNLFYCLIEIYQMANDNNILDSRFNSYKEKERQEAY